MPSSFKEKSGDVIMTHCFVLKGHNLIKDFSELRGFEKYRVRKWFVEEVLSAAVRYVFNFTCKSWPYSAKKT